MAVMVADVRMFGVGHGPVEQVIEFVDLFADISRRFLREENVTLVGSSVPIDREFAERERRHVENDGVELVEGGPAAILGDETVADTTTVGHKRLTSLAKDVQFETRVRVPNQNRFRY